MNQVILFVLVNQSLHNQRTESSGMLIGIAHEKCLHNPQGGIGAVTVYFHEYCTDTTKSSVTGHARPWREEIFQMSHVSCDFEEGQTLWDYHIWYFLTKFWGVLGNVTRPPAFWRVVQLFMTVTSHKAWRVGRISTVLSLEHGDQRLPKEKKSWEAWLGIYFIFLLDNPGSLGPQSQTT